MRDETRKLIRLIMQALLTGITTGGTALLATVQSGTVDKATYITAVVGGIVAAASTLNSGLSSPPGKTEVPNSNIERPR